MIRRCIYRFVIAICVVFVLTFSVNYQYVYMIQGRGKRTTLRQMVNSYSALISNTRNESSTDLKTRTAREATVNAKHETLVNNTEDVFSGAMKNRKPSQLDNITISNANHKNQLTLLEDNNSVNKYPFTSFGHGVNIHTIVGKSNITVELIHDVKTRPLPSSRKSRCYKVLWDQHEFSHVVRHCLDSCRYVSVPIRRGRMGNQMFQIASLLGTAYDLDLIPVISPTFPLHTYFNFPNVKELDLHRPNKCVEKGYGVYSPCRKQGMGQSNVTFEGFRQSWKYFDEIQDVVKQMFRFKLTYRERAREYYSAITKPGHKMIGIHVRRGDITPAKRRAKGNAVTENSFFHNSMKYFTNRYTQVTFIIMSNDMSWCRQNINGDNVHYSPFKNPGHDMALMTFTDHMILTYGTFGWWGAWLSGKPAVYFWEEPRKNSKAALSRIKEDYFPPDWIPMTN